MPTGILKPCCYPGCSALVPSGYCAAHKPKATRSVRQQTDPRYALAIKIRASAQWQKARAWILAQGPLCSDPFDYHAATGPELATQVHHVLPLIERPDLAFDPTNLAPICSGCHARIEASERKGESTAHLFAGRMTADPLAAVLGSPPQAEGKDGSNEAQAQETSAKQAGAADTGGAYDLQSKSPSDPTVGLSPLHDSRVQNKNDHEN